MRVLALAVALLAPTLLGAQSLRYDFEGPGGLPIGEGGVARGTYFLTMSHEGPGSGAQGWSASVVMKNGIIVDAGNGLDPDDDFSTDAAALADQAFHRNDINCPDRRGSIGECEDECGVVSIMVLSFTDSSITLPTNATSTIAFVTIESTDEEASAQATLEYVDGCRGPGQPIDNVVTIAGQSVRPELGRTPIDLGAPDSCVLFEPHAFAFSADRIDSDDPWEGVRGTVDLGLEVCSPEGDCGIVQEVTPGTRGSAAVFFNVVSQSIGGGVDAWSLSAIAADELRVVGATVTGTSADLRPVGLRAPDGFEATRLAGEAGVVSTVILSTTGEAALPPVGTRSVLQIEVESPRVMDDVEQAGRVRFRDGIELDGQPVRNVVSTAEAPPEPPADGSTAPCNVTTAEIGVRFVPIREPIFRRGDANGDGELDLADAVWILEEVFRAGPETPCRAAADSNGDGIVMPISDAIWIIDYRLRGGAPPPAPFPACDRNLLGLPCESSFCPD